jgi:lipoprotein-anchoring transpeptidase ErfK/SrfK
MNFSIVLGLAGVAVSPALAQQSAPAAQSAPARPELDPAIMQLQVVLDRLGFSPGVIDGRPGQSLTQAIRGFQQARDLPVTGRLDAATTRALQPYRGVEPTRVLRLTRADLAGPFAGRLPDDPAEQAKLAEMGYANALERLAEKFHTTPRTLVALNPPGTMLAEGARIRFPNALPTSRDYPADLSAQWRATLSTLNVSPNQPAADRIVVDKSEGVLKVFDKADKLVAQFPATMGSEHDPLPIGEWTIKGTAYNPDYQYDPALLRGVPASQGKHRLPPGPNSPVGVVWMDLSKPHYGIHGTPRPESIGRAESNGCIRLTNWDAARLASMVTPGTKARFQQ